MGTTWSVECFAPPQTTGHSIREILERELENINGQMSHWREDSDLSRFNRAAPGTWIRLPAEFYSVLQFALQTARQTDGAFDPALGAAVNAWGFGPLGSAPSTVPTDGGAWRNIALRPGTGEAFQPGGAVLDLSAIAKGFAVDQLTSALERQGVTSFLIEIGGELSSRGIKPDQEPWWVTVEPPSETFNDEIIIALYNSSIATSGDYRRWFISDGIRFSHTIDPETSAPSRHPIASVTVLHPSAMAADAYSTGLNVMGPVDGLAFADRLDLPAIFLIRSADDFLVRRSQAFERMLDG